MWPADNSDDDDDGDVSDVCRGQVYTGAAVVRRRRLSTNESARPSVCLSALVTLHLQLLLLLRRLKHGQTDAWPHWPAAPSVYAAI